MQSTRTLRALGKLFDGYHETTLSKQQSQKLLEDLKSSFRTNLDREHGHSPRSQPPLGLNYQTASSSAKTTATRQSAVQQHLRDILSNPMFNQMADPAEAAPPAPFAVPGRDPMEVFDHAVSRGMMTLNAATGILRSKRKQMLQESQPLSSQYGAGVALRVLRWLESSEVKDRFLEKQQFVKALLPFLVLEGMEATIWQWFARLVKQIEKGEDLTKIKSASDLLRNLVSFHARSRDSSSLDEAITSLLQADDSLPSPRARNLLLPQAWRSLSWFATVERYKTSAASEALYDAHIAAGQHFEAGTVPQTAHLHLHHPNHPDATPAMQFFENTPLVRHLTQEKFSAFPDRLSSWIVVLANDTMNALLRGGKHAEAEHLSTLLSSGMKSILPADDLTGMDVSPVR